MFKKSLSILAVTAIISFNAPTNVWAQDASIPQNIVSQIEVACSTDNQQGTDNDQDRSAELCATVGADLAAANPTIAPAIAAFTTQSGPEGTGAVLAQLLAEGNAPELPTIVSAIVGADTDNAAEILLSAASAFPDGDQEAILSQLVAQLNQTNPGLLDDTALAALGIPINPAFQSAGVGLFGLDAVSPD